MKTEPKPELSPELIQKAQAGDQGAMTALYEATHQELYRTVHAMVRDEDLTLDIQQDAYVQAFSHLDQLREPENFLPWLRQIAVNRTRSLMRKRTPLLFSQLELGDADEGLEIPDLSPENSPELALDRKETNRLIREILGELSDAQRMLVGMYYYEQIPVGKIAEDLGISPGSVKTQLFRSRKKLESRIRQLESQGVKLFGLSPMPFLLGLLKKAEPPAAAEGKALAGVLTQSAASTASTAVKAVAVHTGRSFFQTALGRVTLGVLAAAALGGGVLGYGRIKDKLLIGDYQPPTPVESDENLSTEPSETVKLETPEDLTTEFILISETEATEPPEDRTEPSTEPKITEATDSDDQTEPVNPGVPAPSSSSTIPVIPVPFPDPASSSSSEETELVTEQFVLPEPSRLLSWRWQEQSSTISEHGYVWNVNLEKEQSRKRLVVSVCGDSVPTIKTDRPDLMVIHELEHMKYTLSTGETASDYVWALTSIGVGTAHISCVLDGETVYTMTAIIPEPQSRYVSTQVVGKAITGDVIQNISDCHVGALYDFKVVVWGEIPPEISTDNPEVILLNVMKQSSENWPNKGYYMESRIVGAGDANVFIKLNGEIKITIPVHSTYLNGGPDQNPNDGPAELVEWDINGNTQSYTLVKGLQGTVYIKINGQEQPELSVDDSTIVSINRDFTSSSNVSLNQMRYWFTIQGIEEGNCTLICKLNGEVVFTIPISVVNTL